MKLFVAKLNRDAVESDLLEWFGAMGPVKSVKIVTDRETGQSKCFGFVEMEREEDGQKAIEEMDGKEFMGFRMVLKEAEDRPRSSAPRTDRTRPTDSRASSGTPAPRTLDFSGSSGGEGRADAPRKSSGFAKKKSSKQKPDKYSDGPRQTKMKKSRGGGGSKEWGDMDDLDF
jgi:RNA recognition motif-containing protein